jgi:predicted NBD/HSP70 family sugar kinase
MLALGKATHKRGGDLMRFYTKPHQFYCGIDLHARSMYVCLVNHDGEILVHRHMKAAPDPFLKAVAPDRDGLVVAASNVSSPGLGWPTSVRKRVFPLCWGMPST